MEAQDFLQQRQPLQVLGAWLAEADQPQNAPDGRPFSKPRHAEAFTLSTIQPTGEPSSRIVLLKELRHDSFVFFTNYESRKGRDLAQNQKASACFYWDTLHRQINIRGTIAKATREVSQKYWDSRPRASQLSGWVSQQSRPVANRSIMEDQWTAADTKWKDQPVPLPENWGGYVFHPTYVEFWIGRDGRFHDRYAFSLTGSSWLAERLYP
jgi:pyridoxamine 5'-phosphate oxidase